MEMSNATVLAEQIADVLFTAPDGQSVNRIRQAVEPAMRNGRQMATMDRETVIERVMAILGHVNKPSAIQKPCSGNRHVIMRADRNRCQCGRYKWAHGEMITMAPGEVMEYA